MNHHLTSLFLRYESEGDSLLAACRTGFGDAAWIDTLGRLTETARAEWHRIASARQISLPTIAFVGPVNSGKSWLAQTLVRDPDRAGELIPDGVARRTERLVWIGPERPPSMTPDVESFIHLDAAQMVDLGMPFQLLDTPGTGDVEKECSRLAEIALSSAQIKVLVVRAEKLRSEDYREFIRFGDGSVILPVVNFCRGAPSTWHSTFAGELMTKLKEAAPGATLLDAICLPDRERAGDPTESNAMIRGRLHSALHDILLNSTNLLASAAETQLTTAHRRFTIERADMLKPEIEPLFEPFEELETAVRALPEKALDYLLADAQKIRVLMKSHFRAAIMATIPQLAFPYRSLVGVLVLTAGAWDRLILGVSGSFPSLIATGFAAVKGTRASGEAVRSLRDQVTPMLSQTVSDSVRAPLARLRNRLAKSGNPVEIQSVAFEVTGIDELVTTWNREVADAAHASSPNRGFLVISSLLGTAGFWFLFGGPLIHLYGQYGPAALRSWGGDWSAAALATYPSMGSGFWISAVMLSLIPTFLVALCTVAWALNTRRARKAETAVRSRMADELQAGTLPLSIVLSDPKVEAARVLLSEIRRASGADASSRHP